MKKILLALALALGGVIPCLAQVEVDDRINEVNDPPNLFMSIYEGGVLVGQEPILDLTTGGSLCTLTSGVKITCNLTTLGGGVAAGDKGDITVGGGGTWTIDNSVVTLAKIQNAAANSKLLGSGAAGSGAAYSEITLGAGLAMTGTTLSSSGSGVADPGGNGLMARTALNTSINRVLTCAAAYCSWADGDGVAGNPTLTLALTATNPGGALVLQGSSPGTAQTGNFNISGGIGTSTRDNIGNTVTDGFFLSNTSAASGGTTQQFSPALKMCGSGWNSSGAASELDCWRTLVQPNSVAGTTNASMRWDVSIAGGAYSTARMTLTSAGSLAAAGSINAGTNIAAGAGSNFVADPAGGCYTFTGHGGLCDNGADGQMRLGKTGGASASGTDLLVGTLTARGNTGVGQSQVFGASVETPILNLVSGVGCGGTTCDTAVAVVPANSIVLGVTFRIGTAITTATTVAIGIAGNTTLFSGAASGTPCGAANIGAGATGYCTAAGYYFNTTQTPVRVTLNSGPGAGTIRIVVHYIQITAPTS